MDCIRIYLAAFGLLSTVACSGCSETNAYVDYASLEAVAPDFEAGANPAYQVELSSSSQPDAQQEPGPQPPTSDDAAAAADTATIADAAAEDVDSQVSTVETDEPADSKLAAKSDVVAAKPETEIAQNEPSLLGTDPMAVQKPSEPRDIKLLIPEKRFRAEGEGNVRVSYDDIDLLKILNMEPVPVDAPRHFPEWLKQLDGQRIRIRGFMYPTFEATGLKGFTLARDNGICCFVRQPMIYDIIGVDLAKGITTDYIDNKPFDVEGVFQIEPEADDMELFQLYRITDAKVLK